MLMLYFPETFNYYLNALTKMFSNCNSLPKGAGTGDDEKVCKINKCVAIQHSGFMYVCTYVCMFIRTMHGKHICILGSATN